MVSVVLPETDLGALGQRLYEEYHIIAPILVVNGFNLIRLSFQAYNDESDADAIVNALKTLL